MRSVTCEPGYCFAGLAVGPVRNEASGETLPPGLTEDEAEEMQLELIKVLDTLFWTFFFCLQLYFYHKGLKGQM